jgi:uncharacterized membrane protein YgaE (UPF0421/DUF939 family)
MLVRGAQLAIRASVGATLALVLARAAHLEFPLYALISAVLVTDFSPAKTSRLGLQRLSATVLGATCGAVVYGVLTTNRSWAIGLSILAAMLLCTALRMSEAAKTAGYICGLVMLGHVDQPWLYAVFRSLETVIGIGIAWLLSFVPSLIRVGKRVDSDHG